MLVFEARFHILRSSVCEEEACFCSLNSGTFPVADATVYANFRVQWLLNRALSGFVVSFSCKDPSSASCATLKPCLMFCARYRLHCLYCVGKLCLCHIAVGFLRIAEAGKPADLGFRFVPLLCLEPAECWVSVRTRNIYSGLLLTPSC